ncbi:uncharacterized protein [Asterias amurensis]|uniref:uncharacterized protein n=1 Tax=Asterias amurensis TaxID=7602 RepID=UPI003AB5ADA8
MTTSIKNEEAIDLSVLSPESQNAGDFFRDLVSEVLPELLSHVEGQSNQDKAHRVKFALQMISKAYRCKLGDTDPWSRSEWDDSANRCAYVFLYYMQHCHMMYMALQPLLQPSLSGIIQRWRQMNHLRVCCIGGGPAPELVGLMKFFIDTNLIPIAMLKCSILDAFPSWKAAWKEIHNKLPEPFPVEYFRCDLVRDSTIDSFVLDAIRKAEILTLVKSFSAVFAFMRDDPEKSVLFQAILRELKPGAVVIYIDNEKNKETWGCFSKYAKNAGLDMLYEWHGNPALPTGEDSVIIQNYSTALELRPMKSCAVSVVLLRKTRPTLSLLETTEINGPAVAHYPGKSRHWYLDANSPCRPFEAHKMGKLQVEWPHHKAN